MTTDPKISELNHFAEDWGRKVANEAKANIRKMAKNGGERGAASIKPSTRQKDGEVEVVSMKLERHLVFFQKDVGEGRPIGRSGRKERPWLNDAVDNNIDSLKDFISENMGDRIVNAARMGIQ